MSRWILRGVAVAIAIIGLIDPAFTMRLPGRARVSIVVQDSPSMGLPAGSASSRRSVADRTRNRLIADLASTFDIQPMLTSDAGAAIVIGDMHPRGLPTLSAVPPLRPAGQTVSTVTVDGPVAPNVRVVRIAAPREVPVGTAIRLEVELGSAGVSGKTTTLTARIGGVEVARVTHQWSADEEEWRAALDAVPVGEPPYIIRVEAPALEAERTAIDNAVDVVVDVRRTPFRVEVYEPRPSWAAAFVRRALEADPRFHVAGITATGRQVETRTADGVPLTSAALAGFDVVIAGGLERLTEADARALDRFMRDRAGSVVLVPDGPMEATRLQALLDLPPAVERLFEGPRELSVRAPLPPLFASELLLVRTDVLGVFERIAWTSGMERAAAVVAVPRGGGRLAISGALDAWRYRAAGNRAFDRFWQAAIAGLALAAPPPIDITVLPSVLGPGEPGEIIVRLRGDGRSAPDRDQAGIRASVDGQPIRLWPEAEAGVYRGTFTAREAGGHSTIAAQLGDRPPVTASRSVVIRSDMRRAIPVTNPPLSTLAASHGGIDTAPEEFGRLEQFIRQTVSPNVRSMPRRPMHSGWWIVPFAACLSGEWWLRRRQGLR